MTAFTLIAALALAAPDAESWAVADRLTLRIQAGFQYATGVDRDIAFDQGRADAASLFGKRTPADDLTLGTGLAVGYRFNPHLAVELSMGRVGGNDTARTPGNGSDEDWTEFRLSMVPITVGLRVGGAGPVFGLHGTLGAGAYFFRVDETFIVDQGRSGEVDEERATAFGGYAGLAAEWRVGPRAFLSYEFRYFLTNATFDRIAWSGDGTQHLLGIEYRFGAAAPAPSPSPTPATPVPAVAVTPAEVVPDAQPALTGGPEVLAEPPAGSGKGTFPFKLGASVAYAIPMGEFAANGAMTSLVSAATPLEASASFDLSRELSVGGWLSYAPGLLSEGGCAPLGGPSSLDGCSVSSWGFGALGEYSLDLGGFEPFVGLRAGLSWLGLRSSTEKWGYKGWEVGLQGGADRKLSDRFSLGAFVGLSLGRYVNSYFGYDSSPTEDRAITRTALHEWVTFGIRGSFGH